MKEYITYTEKYNTLYMSAGPFTTADAWNQTEFAKYVPIYNAFITNKDNSALVNICRKLEKTYHLNLSNIVLYNTLSEALKRN